MMPGTRRNRVSLRLGMTGVRIPRHVGTWRVERDFPAKTPDGDDVVLFVVKHERLDNAARMLVTGDRRVVYVKIPADWMDQLKQEGWNL